jgi:hypothetical protein
MKFYYNSKLPQAISTKVKKIEKSGDKNVGDKLSDLSILLFKSDDEDHMVWAWNNLVFGGKFVYGVITLTYCLVKAGCDHSNVLALDFNVKDEQQAPSNLRIDSRHDIPLSPHSVRRLVALYGESVFLGLLDKQWASSSCREISILDKAMKECREFMDDNFFVSKKPKTIGEARARMWNLKDSIRLGDFDLEQKDDTFLIEGFEVDGLRVRVPKTHYEVAKIGEQLGSNIGNLHHSKAVVDGAPILALYKGETPVFAFTFSPYRSDEIVAEAEVPKVVLLKMKAFFLSRPTDVSKFLLVTDSKWARGYRYDGSNLHIRLASGGIGVYHNVDLGTYEGLVKSRRKGVYINRYIKECYEYTEA